MLVELIVAMVVMAVAVTALVSVYASGIISLRHASLQGNGRALAESRLEELRALPFADLKLASLPPSSADSYFTNPANGVTASDAATQPTGGSGYQAAEATVTGPDNRTYRIDTYILQVAPFPDTSHPDASLSQIFVAVRQVKDGTVGSIVAQASSSSNKLANS
jgi:type II secretory pathway pseudopilin PulG